MPIQLEDEPAGSETQGSQLAFNQMRVLHLLRTQGPLSRADLARRIGVTKATASRIMGELINRNLVREIGAGALSRGRRPILYEFNTTSAVALGVEIRQNECYAVVTELDATPLRTYTLPLADSRVETLLAVLEQLVEIVRGDFPNPLAGMGIGVPGIYDQRQGVVVFAQRLQWTNVRLAEIIRQRLPLNTYIVNRANAAALGEKWYGAGRGRTNLVFITIGSGIKAGLILGGELYVGNNGSAGEIGHMTIVADGPPCGCGKRGCLEAMASTSAMVEHYRLLQRSHVGQLMPHETLLAEAVPPEAGLSDLLAAAQAGEPAALTVMQQAAGYIGLAIANLISVFNPERVILGGLTGQAPALFSGAIRAAAQQHAFSIPWQATDIVVAELGDESVAIGAAALLLSEFLQPTTYGEQSPSTNCARN